MGAGRFSHLRQALDTAKPKVVGIVLAETSTGAWQPIEEISKVVHEAGAMLLVDAVTGLGDKAQPLMAAEDFAGVMATLARLRDLGNTVIVVEHDEETIRTADYVIDLGPEGGEDGGRVLAMATPEQVAHVPASHTGTYIREVLSSGKLLQTVTR